MDLPSRERWYDYSRARDVMLEATDTEHAPWYIVRSDDKKRARLNAIAHLLSAIPYKKRAAREDQAAQALQESAPTTTRPAIRIDASSAKCSE